MNWVLIAGLIRDQENALIQCKQIKKFMDQGLIEGVVFSTWHGEFNRYPDVKDAYMAIGATLVESQEPKIVFTGHILHQSISLIRGLEFIPDNKFVLRIRPDIAPINDSFEMILDQRWLKEDSIESLKPNVFSERVWIHSGLTMWPFYLNDILFYGKKQDIFKICNFDIKNEWFLNELAPEQFFHLSPFLKNSKILSLFSRVHRGKHSSEENIILNDVLWNSDFWYLVLRETAELLVANYYAGFMSPKDIGSAPFVNLFSEISIKNITNPDQEIPFIYMKNGDFYGSEFHSLAWAVALLNDGYKNDSYKERFNKVQENLTDEKINSLALEFSNNIKKIAPEYCPQIPELIEMIMFNPKKQIRKLFLENLDTTATLNEEINRLRREISKQSEYKD